MWIAIEGNICSGKTTLIEHIKSNNSNLEVFKEPTWEWNDYLNNFYNGGSCYLLQSKISSSFLKIESLIGDNDCVTERSMYSCYNIFNRLNKNVMSQLEYNVLDDLYGLSRNNEIDYYIYLRCDTDTLMDRFSRRGDSYNVDRVYLEKLNDMHESVFGDLDNVFVVDGTKDILEVYEDVSLFIKHITNKN